MLYPRLLPFAVVLALAGCGGGLWIGVGDDGFDDPPSVNLAVSPDAARSGDTVRLAAAASDDFAIDHVDFFRLQSDGSALLLGSDSAAPYQLDAAMPITSTSQVQFFARAVDDRDQASDSALVGVTLVP
jgi:hypothetical protein